MSVPGRPARGPALPHVFPFELVDRPAEGVAVIRLSAGAALSRGGPLPASLAIEMLAQAAIVQLGGEDAPAGGGPMLLVGIEEARFAGLLAPGTSLRAEIERAGSFGRLVKIRGRLTDEGGELVAEAALMLAAAGS